MEHEAAVENQSVERYILGEMPPEERDAFEEHYFSCAECGEDVRHAAAFIANAKAVFRGDEEVAAPRQVKERRDFFWWLRPAWAPALAGVFLAVIGYQGLVEVPGLKKSLESASEPRQVVSAVLRAESRGAEKVIQAGPSEPLLLAFDINPEQTFAKYVAEIESTSGKVVSRTQIAPPGADEPVSIYVPAGKLAPGQYTLVIRGDTAGNAGPVVGRSRFELQRK